MSILAQGPLTPPGPPAPTMQTLDDLGAKLDALAPKADARIVVNAANTPGDATNSFIISQPGSYYLTGNITGESGKHGISIQADDVTLDLNGFALISGGGGATRGVNVPAAQSNFSIRNGSVRGWTDGGVRGAAAIMLAEKLLLANNTGAVGLDVGNGSMIRDCVASGNATGFHANDRTQLISCISTVNTGRGFDCTSFVTLLDCTSSRNGNDGIAVQGSCTVTRCNASRNVPLGTGTSGGNGIRAGTGCTVIGCTANSNSSTGIFIGMDGVVKDCTAGANGATGVLGDRCSIIDCTANSNGSAGSSAGINAGAHSLVKNCAATNNTGDGIRVSSGSVVLENQCSNNSANGILVGDGLNRIDSNHTSDNGGKGIRDGPFGVDWVVRNTGFNNIGGDFPGAGVDVAPTQPASTATNPFANLQ